MKNTIPLLFVLSFIIIACGLEEVPGPEGGNSTSNPPTACITLDQSSCEVGCTINFDASCSVNTSSSTTYNWDFGDGTTGTGKNAAHTYNVVGEFTIKLTVTNTDSKMSEATSAIVITSSNFTSFARTYSSFGNSESNFALETEEGDYVICGVSDSNSIVFKINSKGEYTGVNHIFGNQNATTSFARKIIEDKEGNYVVAGHEFFDDDRKAFAAKFNKVLSPVGEQTYYGSNSREEVIEEVIETEDGKYLIAGFDYKVNENARLIVLRLNNDLSFKDAIDIPNQRCYDIIPAFENNQFILAGYSEKEGDATNNWEYLALKMSDDLVFDTNFEIDNGENNNSDWFLGAIGHPNQKEYLFIGSANVPSNNFWMGNAYLVKIGADGTFINRYFPFDETHYTRGEDVVVADDGNYVITGDLIPKGGTLLGSSQDIWLAKIEKGQDGGVLGEIIWERRFDTGKGDIVRALLKTSDGGFLITGLSAEPYMAFIIKVDANGCVQGEGKEFLVESKGVILCE